MPLSSMKKQSVLFADAKKKCLISSLCGNNCGHDPLNPRWYLPKRKCERPDVIRIASTNIKNYFNSPNKWLCSTWNIRESNRKQRSEARERNGAVIQVLLDYVELASLRVGMPKKDGSFLSSSLKFIAERAGFRRPDDPVEQGIKRTWRALNELARAGYLKIHRRFKQYQDSEAHSRYRGLPAVKTIRPKLFLELGISKTKLTIRRQQANKRLKKKNWQPKQELFKLIQPTKKQPQPLQTFNHKPIQYRTTQKEIEQKRARIMILMELRQQYPNLSLRELDQKITNAAQAPPD